MKNLKTILEDAAKNYRETARMARRCMDAETQQARAWEEHYPESANRRHEAAKWESIKAATYDRMADEAEKFAGQLTEAGELPPHPGY